MEFSKLNKILINDADQKEISKLKNILKEKDFHILGYSNQEDYLNDIEHLYNIEYGLFDEYDLFEEIKDEFKKNNKYYEDKENKIFILDKDLDKYVDLRDNWIIFIKQNELGNLIPLNIAYNVNTYEIKTINQLTNELSKINYNLYYCLEPAVYSYNNEYGYDLDKEEIFSTYVNNINYDLQETINELTIQFNKEEEKENDKLDKDIFKNCHLIYKKLLSDKYELSQMNYNDILNYEILLKDLSDDYKNLSEKTNINFSIYTLCLEDIYELNKRIFEVTEITNSLKAEIEYEDKIIEKEDELER